MATFRRIPQRIRLRDDHAYGITDYGRTNTYPQEALYALKRSGIAQAAVNVLTKFLYGDGFADDFFGRVVINSRGETANELLYKLARQYATFNGFALIANHNALGEYTSTYACPFEFVRKGLEDDYGQTDYYRVWNNWAGESPQRTNPISDIKTFAKFDPVTAQENLIEMRQIQMTAYQNGMQISSEFEYSGQLMYSTTVDGGYPSATFDAVMEQTLTTGDLSDFDRAYVRNRFSASTVFVDRSPTLDAKVREANAIELAKMGSSENAGGIVLLNGDIESLNPNVNDVGSNRGGLKEELADDITTAYNMPPILLGKTRQGGFPNQDEMIDAYRYFNAMTRELRRKISGDLERLFTQWHFDANPSGNYAIKERTFIETDNG